MHRVRHMHDTVVYSWDKIPDIKKKNWLAMNRQIPDTENFSVPGFPYVLQIEPTNLCNLLCPTDPAGKKELQRPLRHMSLREFRSLTDDMEKYLLLMILWDWGEPLMNPDLPAMIRYASEHDIRTVTSTNGHFLSNGDYVAELLSSGLSTLIIAVDSTCAQSYESYRREGDISRVVSGIANAVAIKRKLDSDTVINLRMVLMRQNEHEIGKVRAFAREVGADRFTVKTLNPSCGNSSLDEEYVPLNTEYRRYRYHGDTWERVRIDNPCRRVWMMSNIFANGEVVPCCYDYSGSMKVGNLKDSPFSEIWMSPEYRELRKKVYHEKNRIAICRDCVCSFQESDTGWFYEATEFNGVKGRSLWETAVQRLVAPQMLRRYHRLGRFLGR